MSCNWNRFRWTAVFLEMPGSKSDPPSILEESMHSPFWELKP